MKHCEYCDDVYFNTLVDMQATEDLLTSNLSESVQMVANKGLMIFWFRVAPSAGMHKEPYIRLVCKVLKRDIRNAITSNLEPLCSAPCATLVNPDKWGGNKIVKNRDGRVLLPVLLEKRVRRPCHITKRKINIRLQCALWADESEDGELAVRSWADNLDVEATRDLLLENRVKSVQVVAYDNVLINWFLMSPSAGLRGEKYIRLVSKADSATTLFMAPVDELYNSEKFGGADEIYLPPSCSKPTEGLAPVFIKRSDSFLSKLV